jgi:hypothetical protein
MMSVHGDLLLFVVATLEVSSNAALVYLPLIDILGNIIVSIWGGGREREKEGKYEGGGYHKNEF